ncbi:hypothetical protein K402DRAFT_314827, partial [Aulographum hederae CBS 113979]
MAAYISGYNNSMDVAGFGFNTQSAMFYQSQHAALDFHQGVTCSGCNANPLRSIRWHCTSCPNHDICNNCKKAGNSPGHPFQIMSMTSTNKQNTAAQGKPLTAESGVHWVTCKGCGSNPIRGCLSVCTVYPDFNLCRDCNTQRLQAQNHQHRFDFFYMPRPGSDVPQGQQQ